MAGGQLRRTMLAGPPSRSAVAAPASITAAMMAWVAEQLVALLERFLIGQAIEAQPGG